MASTTGASNKGSLFETDSSLLAGGLPEIASRAALRNTTVNFLGVLLSNHDGEDRLHFFRDREGGIVLPSQNRKASAIRRAHKGIVESCRRSEPDGTPRVLQGTRLKHKADTIFAQELFGSYSEYVTAERTFPLLHFGYLPKLGKGGVTTFVAGKVVQPLHPRVDEGLDVDSCAVEDAIEELESSAPGAHGPRMQIMAEASSIGAAYLCMPQTSYSDVTQRVQDRVNAAHS